MKNTLLILVILLASPSTFAETHKAHVHGLAKVALAVETENTANIDLDVAGDSIMGFEHPAKSEKDKKTMADSFQKLKSDAASVIRFDPALKCVVTVKEVGLEKAEPKEVNSKEAAHGEHSDVNASYSVKCEKSLSGSKVQVGLIALFPKVKSATLEILTTKGQTQETVKSEHYSVTIP